MDVSRRLIKIAVALSNKDESWKLTWPKIKKGYDEERESARKAILIAEGKYHKAMAEFKLWESKTRQQIKRLVNQLNKLNPTGDSEDIIDQTNKREWNDAKKKYDVLYGEFQRRDIPIRSNFVDSELPPRTLPSGQYEHKKIVEKAYREGKPVPSENLKLYGII